MGISLIPGRPSIGTVGVVVVTKIGVTGASIGSGITRAMGDYKEELEELTSTVTV